jgi:hypothetical protein
MASSVLVCGALFDGISEELARGREILVRDGRIVEMDGPVDRPE